VIAHPVTRSVNYELFVSEETLFKIEMVKLADPAKTGK
jgi:hypothetical protein